MSTPTPPNFYSNHAKLHCSCCIPCWIKGWNPIFRSSKLKCGSLGFFSSHIPSSGNNAYERQRQFDEMWELRRAQFPYETALSFFHGHVVKIFVYMNTYPKTYSHIHRLYYVIPWMRRFISHQILNVFAYFWLMFGCKTTPVRKESTFTISPRWFETPLYEPPSPHNSRRSRGGYRQWDAYPARHTMTLTLCFQTCWTWGVRVSQKIVPKSVTLETYDLVYWCRRRSESRGAIVRSMQMETFHCCCCWPCLQILCTLWY